MVGEEPLIKPLIDIPRQQEVVVEMIHDALDAFVRMDVEQAKAVTARDDEVDALYNQVLRELLTYMMQDAKTVYGATYLLWVAHNLERIGDRATNIAERVIPSLRKIAGQELVAVCSRRPSGSPSSASR